MRTRVPMARQSGLLIAACVVLLGSCSLMPQSRMNMCSAGASLTNPDVGTGIGGTGQLAQRTGIGGTGRPLTLAEVGIGGTGIVGVVTGFASICVNGEEVHYTASTPVFRDGEPGSTSDLLVGQVVAIRADGALSEPRERLQASRIAVLNAAVGPLTSVDADSGQFEVMGQKAQALASEDLEHLMPGDWVRVSGLRQADGSIRASRVEALAAPLAQAQVLGPVLNIDGQQVRIGTTPVQFRSLPAALTVGSELVVRGRWTGNVLEAATSAPHPLHAELGAAKDVLLQAYVHGRRGNELMLGYAIVQLSGATSVSGGQAEAIGINQPVLVRGKIDADQRIVADQLIIGSESGGSGRDGLDRSGRRGSSNGSLIGGGLGGDGGGRRTGGKR